MVSQSQLGNALADAIELVGPSLVHLSAGGQRLASGFVWRAADGLIATTSRLFSAGTDLPIEARLADGVARSATRVGHDEATGLGLVRIEATGSPIPVEPPFAPGEALRVGTLVAPLARTERGVRAVLGLISGLGGPWVTPLGGVIDRYIDVDGKLPPGFSGGPLIDFEGRVHGLDTRGLIPGGTTVPVATLERVFAQLLRGESGRPGHLGVAIREVELPPHVVAQGPGHTHGLLVTWLAAGSPAAEAGLEIGDVITAIAGSPTPDHAHLLAALSGRAGLETEVDLIRHGLATRVTAVPAARAERRQQRQVRGWSCR